MKSYQCGACYFPFEEELGLPDHGIPIGTKWEDVPDDFICPDCGTPKALWIEWHKD